MSLKLDIGPFPKRDADLKLLHDQAHRDSLSAAEGEQPSSVRPAMERQEGRVISLSPCETPPLHQKFKWGTNPQSPALWTQSPFTASSVASGRRTPPMWGGQQLSEPHARNSPMLSGALKLHVISALNAASVSVTNSGLSGPPDLNGQPAESANQESAAERAEDLDKTEHRDSEFVTESEYLRTAGEDVCDHDPTAKGLAEFWGQWPRLPMHIPGLQDDDHLGVPISDSPEPETASQISLSDASDFTSISKRMDFQASPPSSGYKHSSFTQMYLHRGSKESKEQTIMRLKAKLKAEALAARQESIMHEERNRTRRQIVQSWLNDPCNFPAESCSQSGSKHVDAQAALAAVVQTELPMSSCEIREFTPENVVDPEQKESHVNVETKQSGETEVVKEFPNGATIEIVAECGFIEPRKQMQWQNISLTHEHVDLPRLGTLREDQAEEVASTSDLHRAGSSGSGGQSEQYHMDAPRCGCLPSFARKKSTFQVGSSANSALSSSAMSTARTTIATPGQGSHDLSATEQSMEERQGTQPGVHSERTKVLQFVSSGITTPSSIQSDQMSPSRNQSKWLVGNLAGKKFMYPELDGPLSPVSSMTASVSASFVYGESSAVSPLPMPEVLSRPSSAGKSVPLEIVEPTTLQRKATSPSGRPAIWDRE